MKRSFAIAFIGLSIFSTQAGENFPKGSTLQPENLICKKDGHFRCLSEHIKKDGKLENVAIDGIQYEIKKGDSDYDAKLFVNGILYMEFAHHGRSIEKLSKMMDEKIKEAKDKGKKTLVIPKITGNGNFFIGSPAFRFGLPVFDGPTEQELHNYKIEFKYKNRIKELDEQVKKEQRSASYYETEKRILDSENARLRRRLIEANTDKKECENKLTQTDQVPINLNRNSLNGVKNAIPEGSPSTSRDEETLDQD